MERAECAEREMVGQRKIQKICPIRQSTVETISPFHLTCHPSASWAVGSNTSIKAGVPMIKSIQWRKETHKHPATSNSSHIKGGYRQTIIGYVDPNPCWLSRYSKFSTFQLPHPNHHQGESQPQAGPSSGYITPSTLECLVERSRWRSSPLTLGKFFDGPPMLSRHGYNNSGQRMDVHDISPSQLQVPPFGLKPPSTTALERVP